MIVTYPHLEALMAQLGTDVLVDPRLRASKGGTIRPRQVRGAVGCAVAVDLSQVLQTHPNQFAVEWHEFCGNILITQRQQMFHKKGFPITT